MIDNENKIEQMFFDLMQVALGRKVCLTHSPSAEEWKGLYEMAKKQSLVGVCFAAVQKLQSQHQTPDEMLYLKWMGMAAKIQQRNEVVNRQCVELQERLKKIGYRSCILKGQSAAALYRWMFKVSKVSEGLKSGTFGTCEAETTETTETFDLTHLRQSGDIDVWVDASRKEIIEMVQKVAPTTNVREHHLDLQFFQDTEVEVHFWPAVIRHFRKNRKLQKWFEGKCEEVFEKGEPTPEFHAIQMMAHMYHHLFDSGIGLRQVMDYYFVLQSLKVNESMSQQECYDAIWHIGMGRFASAMMYVLQVTMGLEREKMICEPNVEDGEFLLGEIMRGGNFGNHDDRKVRDTSNYFSSFYGSIFRNMRYLRFNPFDWFWSPMWRLYYFGWRKINGYH